MGHTPFPTIEKEPLLKIHILTDGEPVIEAAGEGLTKVSNAIIGEGFHWQTGRQLVFAGQMLTDRGRLFNIIGLESYLKSVVASEMSPAAHPEFLKAHAIISRSWALGKYLGRHHRDASRGKTLTPGLIVDWADESDHTDCHLCNDDHCQRYQGLPDSDSAQYAAEAVSATSGLVLTSEEGLVDARFSKSCGGVTELFSSCWDDYDPSYLKSVVDPYCDLSSMTRQERARFLSTVMQDYDASTPSGPWEAVVSRSDIRTKIREILGFDPGEVIDLVPVKRGPSGRIVLMRFKCEGRCFTAGKELLIRRLLSPSHLLSSCFSVSPLPDGFRLSGRGWGHGVGLCQTGAARMAELGHSAADILGFYYPGTSITKAYST